MEPDRILVSREPNLTRSPCIPNFLLIPEGGPNREPISFLSRLDDSFEYLDEPFRFAETRR